MRATPGEPPGYRRGAEVRSVAERVLCSGRVNQRRARRPRPVCRTGGTLPCDNVGIVRWMHRVRLYPTVAQAERLGFMLDVTRQTYNALLDQRRYAWSAR